MVTISELRRRIGRFPRIKLTDLPTPLEELDRLAKAVGGPRFLMKRDDLTALALGGNKLRKLQFALGHARQQGAGVIVTGGAVQSNHCRLAAAAAAKLGLECVLILNGHERTPPQGNLLLDRLFGAEVRFVSGTQADVDRAIPKVAEELRAAGKHPYTMHVAGGDDTVFGVLGYVEAYAEIAEQLDPPGSEVTHVCVCAGSGVTQAGLLLGAKLLGQRTRVVGISIRRSKAELDQRIRDAVRKGADALDCSVSLSDEDVCVYDECIGPGYGGVTPELRQAIHLLARTSGILIDHVYAGKTLAGVLALIRRGTLKPEDQIVFVHTGGVAAMFAAAQEMLEDTVSGS